MPDLNPSEGCRYPPIDTAAVQRFWTRRVEKRLKLCNIGGFVLLFPPSKRTLHMRCGGPAPTEDDEDSPRPKLYRIETIVCNYRDGKPCDVDITVSLVRKVAHEQYGCTITSHGGEIRRALFDSCPARCDQGLLQDQDAQHSLLADSVPRIHEDYRPLCPVYIGFRLSMRFAELRYTRETSHVQINAVSDFYSDLNHRRQHLQYEPESLEFDMSQWELPSREEWEGWQTWEKALDPNADPVFHCASDNAIAVLRRTPYAKIDKSEAMENCAICGSEWDESSVLVELPCAHSYCECIEQWLKTSNACPECRAPLLEVETKDGVMVESNENVEQTTEQAEMEAVTTSKEDGNGLDVEEDGGPSASITAGEE